jgi:protein gp37
MADRSRIAWTNETWNVTTGCSKVTAGCANCYAVTAATRCAHIPAYEGLVAGGEWTGRVNLLYDRLAKPLQQTRPRRIFVDSTSDPFHPAVPDEFLVEVLAVMACCPQHTFQVLTKRPRRMAAFFAQLDPGDVELAARASYRCGGRERAAYWGPEDEMPWPLPNLWAGTTVEDASSSFRLAHLRAVSAPVRWVSAEPLLGPLHGLDLAGIDWLVVGGESGRGARRMDPGWARELRDRCTEAGVAFFFKQAGAVLAREWGCTHSAGADLEEVPSEFRVRQYPR